MKPLEYVIEGLKLADSLGRNTFVTDDNFAVSKKRTMNLIEAMESAGLDKKRMRIFQATVKIGEDYELMDSLVKYFDAVCLGIESLNDETLRSWNKPYSSEDNKRWVKEIRKRGLWVHGMMMLGGDGDTLETLRETGKWANENLDSAQFCVPTPFPGTRFFNRMKEEGRILTEDWSLYNAQSVVVRPKNISPAGLQQGVYKMYRDFYSPFRTPLVWFKRLYTSSKKASQIGVSIYAMGGGLDRMLDDPQSRVHMEFLRSVS